MTTREREQILEVLSRLSPCFDRANPKPLAVGIKQAIQKELPDLNGDHLHLFLRWWTGRNSYFRAVAADGSCRHSWNGETGAQVDQAHRTYSANVLAKRQLRAQTTAATLSSEIPTDDRGEKLQRGRLYELRVPGFPETNGRVETNPDTNVMVALLNNSMIPVPISKIDPAATWERLI